MDREDHRDIIALRDVPHRIGDPAHAFAEILAAVAGYADDPLARETFFERGEA